MRPNDLRPQDRRETASKRFRQLLREGAPFDTLRLAWVWVRAWDEAQEKVVATTTTIL